MRNGQTSMEYLTILGGVLAVVVIVGIFISNSLLTGYDRTDNNWFGFLPTLVKSDEAKISNPTNSNPLYMKANIVTPVKIIIAVGSSVTGYEIVIRGRNPPDYCYISKTITNPSGNNTSINEDCGSNFKINQIGDYDIIVTARTSAGTPKVFTQKAAIKVQ